MDETVQKSLQNVDRAEADLNRLLKNEPQRVPYPALEPDLAKLRNACQDAFFLDLSMSADHNVETRLWAAHQNVNNAFKLKLKALRKESEKVVERRKAEKLYLTFIKSSLRFYRTFIQRICSHFSGMTELYSIARQMHLDLLSVDTPVDVDVAQKQQLLKSCHTTLIHCGDLSRYREVELAQKTRDWGPAKGYYECAAQLDPTSGISFNQLSMMALVDEDNFRALYFNYRCLATANPFPAADDNLIRLLKKIRTKTLEPSTVETKLAAAELPFIKLHALLRANPDLGAFRDAQNDLMLALQQVIPQQSCGKSLKRVCLINIAALSHATKLLSKSAEVDPEHFEGERQMFYMVLELNITTFTILLRLMSTELDLIAPQDDQESSRPQLTANSRKLLPCLRLYSAWLLSNIDTLLAHSNGTIANDLPLAPLWAVYGRCIRILAIMFTVQSIEGIAYLLDEDEDMLHFTPFLGIVSEMYLCNTSGAFKPTRGNSRGGDTSNSSRSQIEMANRVKGVVTVAEHLQNHYGSVPWLAEIHTTKDTPAREELPQFNQNIHSSQSHAVTNGTSFHTAHHLAQPLESMVDDLVGPEPPATAKRASRSHLSIDANLSPYNDFGIENRPSSVAASPLLPRPSPPVDSPALSFSTPAPHRRSFSLHQTPFTPIPGELDGSGSVHSNSRPSTSHDRRSPQRPVDSSVAFQDTINRRKIQLAERSSPLSSAFPSLSTGVSDTPTGFTTFARGAHSRFLSNDGFQSPLGTSSDGVEVPRKQEAAPGFGAIGEGRRNSAKGNMKTPTSGQPR